MNRFNARGGVRSAFQFYTFFGVFSNCYFSFLFDSAACAAYLAAGRQLLFLHELESEVCEHFISNGSLCAMSRTRGRLLGEGIQKDEKFAAK